MAKKNRTEEQSETKVILVGASQEMGSYPLGIGRIELPEDTGAVVFNGDTGKRNLNLNWQISPTGKFLEAELMGGIVDLRDGSRGKIVGSCGLYFPFLLLAEDGRVFTAEGRNSCYTGLDGVSDFLGRAEGRFETIERRLEFYADLKAQIPVYDCNYSLDLGSVRNRRKKLRCVIEGTAKDGPKGYLIEMDALEIPSDADKLSLKPAGTEARRTSLDLILKINGSGKLEKQFLKDNKGNKTSCDYTFRAGVANPSTIIVEDGRVYGRRSSIESRRTEEFLNFIAVAQCAKHYIERFIKAYSKRAEKE